MEIISRSFTAEEFVQYLKIEVAPRMGTWRPGGIVLHNTWAPLLSNWPGKDVKGVPISVNQRLANIKYGYEQKGWSGGPHLFIDTKQISVFTPLWQKGVHSPSFNNTHWGIELVGNYDIEAFQPSMRRLAQIAIIEMYHMLGKTPTMDNFKFHRDDPRTSHKNCPGKNIGTKEEWVFAVNNMQGPPVVASKPSLVVNVKPVEPAPRMVLNKVNDATLNLVKRWESFVAKEYSDRGFPAIGYGRRSGFRGFQIVPGMIITEPQAASWLRDDLTYLGETVSKLVTVDLNDNQFGALCSFAYNVGIGNLKASTLLKKVNAGDFQGAALEFQKWCKARDKNGQLVRLEGLYKRRTSEMELFKLPV